MAKLLAASSPESLIVKSDGDLFVRRPGIDRLIQMKDERKFLIDAVSKWGMLRVKNRPEIGSDMPIMRKVVVKGELMWELVK